MFGRRKWTWFPLLLLLLFTVVACGPPLSSYTARESPAPTPSAGRTDGTGTGKTSPTSKPGQSETSSSGETTDGTEPEPSPTDTTPPPDTETPTATPTTSVAEAPIECSQYRLPTDSASPPESIQADDSLQTPDLVVDVTACSVARLEASDFAGCLFVSVQLRNQIDGATALSPVLVTLTSHTGLNGQESLSPDREPEFNQIRVDLHAEQFNREHLLTINVNPDGQITESDHDNNSTEIKIKVPSEDTVEVIDTRCLEESPNPTPTPTAQGGADGATPLAPQTDPAAAQG
jgi:hypothetical protein